MNLHRKSHWKEQIEDSNTMLLVLLAASMGLLSTSINANPTTRISSIDVCRPDQYEFNGVMFQNPSRYAELIKVAKDFDREMMFVNYTSHAYLFDFKNKIKYYYTEGPEKCCTVLRPDQKEFGSTELRSHKCLNHVDTLNSTSTIFDGEDEKDVLVWNTFIGGGNTNIPKTKLGTFSVRGPYNGRYLPIYDDVYAEPYGGFLIVPQDVSIGVADPSIFNVPDYCTGDIYCDFMYKINHL